LFLKEKFLTCCSNVQ